MDNPVTGNISRMDNPETGNISRMDNPFFELTPKETVLGIFSDESSLQKIAPFLFLVAINYIHLPVSGLSILDMLSVSGLSILDMLPVSGLSILDCPFGFFSNVY
jgi:hypothetical protein